MVYKKLSELSAGELRIELKRVGIKGKFVKSQAIVRLTTHLIDVSEDPQIFEFDLEVPIEEADVDDNEYEVINDGPEATTAGNTAASVAGLVDAINSGASGVSAAVTLPSQPTSFVVTSTASMNTSTVTTSTANSSIPSTLPSSGTSGAGISSQPNHYVGIYAGMVGAGTSAANQYNPWNIGAMVNPWMAGMMSGMMLGMMPGIMSGMLPGVTPDMTAGTTPGWLQ